MSGPVQTPLLLHHLHSPLFQVAPPPPSRCLCSPPEEPQVPKVSIRHQSLCQQAISCEMRLCRSGWNSGRQIRRLTWMTCFEPSSGTSKFSKMPVSAQVPCPRLEDDQHRRLLCVPLLLSMCQLYLASPDRCADNICRHQWPNRPPELHAVSWCDRSPIYKSTTTLGDLFH